jgi:hypothetical protein
MSLFHGRWQEQMALLASGALGGEERHEAEAHRDGCAECGREFTELRSVVEALGADPVREEPFPIALSALESRVFARLAEEPLRESPTKGQAPVPHRLTWIAAAAAMVTLAVVSLQWLPRLRTGGERPVAATSQKPPITETSTLPEPVMVSEDTLLRLERNLARQRTARYLSEAEDVLVTVAAAPARCPRGKERIDMADQARRSRELLARRSLLVDGDAESTSQTQALLDDVEQVLRDVAALPACARSHDLDAINRDLSRRRLLMKIDLMTQELQG